MNITSVIQDIVLYVAVVVGILVYKSVLFHHQGQTGSMTPLLRKRQNRKFFVLFCILTLLFIIGVIHQFGLLAKYISMGIAGFLAVLGIVLVGWLRISIQK